MDYLDMSIAEIHSALVNKQITPLELTRLALQKAKGNKENAFEYICEKEALEFASSLDEPEPDNLLWGIPYVCKDNFSTKGIPTTASSNVLEGYVPLFDATVVQKLAEKKAILIGKTTLDELAMGGTGTTGHKGTTFNPYDPEHKHLIGGSSCGSAVAVAAGIVPFSIGSDTGDSVRKPASYGGLVGMKATWGRVSRYGLFGFAPSLDHVGFFTRSIADAALLLEALAGRDEMDSTSSFQQVEHYSLGIDAGVKGKRIAVIQNILDTIGDKRVISSFQKTIDKLILAGACIDYVDFPAELLEAIFPAYIVISCAEATSSCAGLDGVRFGPYRGGSTYQEVMSNARTKGFSELIKRRFVIGSFALMSENREELFERAQKARAKIVQVTNEILASHDAIYLPAAPTVAPLAKNASERLPDELPFADNYLEIGNFAGLPSITLPLTMLDGYPLGVNLTGRAFDEKNLFAIARGVESITGLEGIDVNVRKEALV